MCFSSLIILLAAMILILWGLKVFSSCIIIEQDDDDDNIVVAVLNALPFLFTGGMFLLLSAGYSDALAKILIPLANDPKASLLFFIVAGLLLSTGIIMNKFIIVPWRLTRWAQKRGFNLLSYETTKGVFWKNLVSGRSKYQSFYTLMLKDQNKNTTKIDVVIGSYWGINPNRFWVNRV